LLALAMAAGCADERTVVRRQTEVYSAQPAPPVSSTTVIERRQIEEDD
jgi:hypothetical protein